MKKEGIGLNLHIDVQAWEKIPQLRSRAKAAAQAVFDALPQTKRATGTATILLTGNAKVRQLNHDFRGLNKATNVLSFPQYEPRDLRRFIGAKQPIELGDIAIAYHYTAKEAKEESKTLLDHTTHLIVHGLLHLVGYDHIEDKEAQRMEKLETKIMKALGAPDPYGN